MPMKILVINPGSTSTKMAVYDRENPILAHCIAHTAEELARFDAITEQQDFRKQLVLDELKHSNIALDFDAVIGRGGLVKPISGGVYEINQRMLEDTLHGCVMHNHACNLGCLIAYEIANLLDVERLSKVVFVPAVAHMCHLVDVDFLLRTVAHETVL